MRLRGLCGHRPDGLAPVKGLYHEFREAQLTRLSSQLIKKSGGGSILNIGSVAGITGSFSTGYSSSKWARQGLSRSAAYVYVE